MTRRQAGRQRAKARRDGDPLAVACPICKAEPGRPCFGSRYSDGGQTVTPCFRFNPHPQRMPITTGEVRICAGPRCQNRAASLCATKQRLYCGENCKTAAYRDRRRRGA